ncbi:wall-associated receptor kinase 3-like [Canna indica]|uniref:Wall-associated receptor kinase 3-like n=1 Tax=Canna indica TaxID=4628 RepID=A0AAQ3K3W8_9LILI|nr:wall-associated receptor kinase 3-like [Canna indica]
MEFLLAKMFLVILITSLCSITSAQSTSTNLTFALPPNCSKRCGNISIEYPFGIGNGCFRSGFNLTCRNDSNPPRLLLGDGRIEVKNIDLNQGVVYIKPPVVTMGINVYSMSAPVIDMENWPFSFQLTSSGTWVSNDWYVFGCSACAILLNFTGNTISTCSTMCSGDPWDKYCSLRSYTWGTPLDIQLYRLNQTELHLASSSVITAVIMIDGFSDYDINEIMRGNYSGVNTTLAWYINDSKFTTCAKAKKNKATYACLSSNSECYEAYNYDVPNSNQTVGYICRCSVSYHGNPYLPHGCQLDESFKASPLKDCETKCGSVDVQFPFGMKQGCYRDESFALACDKKTTTLRYQDDIVVTNISLEEGHLEFNDTANRHYISYGSHYISYSSLSRDTNPYLDLFSLLDQHEVYTWVVAYKSCEDAKKDNKTFACVDQHSQCIETNTTRNGILGYRCKCSKGYEGNPYLQDGCRDINECLHRDKYICYGICTNTDGGYNCTCEPDSSGDPRKEPCNPNKKRPVLLGGLYKPTHSLTEMTKYIDVQCLRLDCLAKKLEKYRLFVLEKSEAQAREIEPMKARLEEMEKTLKARDDEILDLNGATIDITTRTREAWDATNVLRGKVANS